VDSGEEYDVVDIADPNTDAGASGASFANGKKGKDKVCCPLVWTRLGCVAPPTLHRQL
jgi:hypothetical protein